MLALQQQQQQRSRSSSGSPRNLSTRRQQAHPEAFSSRYGAGKSSTRVLRTRSRERQSSTSRRLLQQQQHRRREPPDSPPDGSSLTPATVTLCVGPEKRLFAAHRDIICVSPYFAAVCARARAASTDPNNTSSNNPIYLPDEQPEILSCILEYLYRGDYFPRLLHNKTRNTWQLETASSTTGSSDAEPDGATIFHQGVGAEILRDTAVYCAAQKYGLETLKRLALRKQGLHSGISCSTILTSARYAYAHTPDTESKLRAHYLALIIRSRSTFKRSGTMQMEMEQGGKLFFDLFVAMCNHMDDLTGASGKQQQSMASTIT
ncbi:hypothetical protein ASPACDRAFT_117619 [Aspergillus aculeatus ATCC 16872]|uniref:BTB domain-containing protein n=1 Tax=Aspergillus aculeatus (strain ATCC 16872 / CBS 172.66 / WB 5094) TaxID=690307 RepID=A0A1L9WXP2_ASPA1|nr:uncharacterized protein ASPACDRAFT_117619 [Aspergillus aculeatus ATCC 16872]OJK00980.1 hypothetical protein ASPACDRAFT_117619 [Aspergillus aculeatus ATCC 16872]